MMSKDERIATGNRTFWVLWESPIACWVGVSGGASKVSRLFPGHAAVASLFDRIMGHWGTRWIVHEVRLVRFSHRMSMTWNGVKDMRLTARKQVVDVEVARTQRTTGYLVDVAYACKATLVATSEGAAQGIDLDKYLGMTINRMEHGQIFGHQPYFGQRECGPVTYEWIRDERDVPVALDVSEDYGLDYFDTDYTDGSMYLCHYQANRGVLAFPTMDEVKKLNLKFNQRKV